MFQFEESPLAKNLFSIPVGIRNIIFDYDGTIATIPIDWKKVRLDCYNHLKQRFDGLEIGKNQRLDEMEALALSFYPDEAEYIFAFRSRVESNCSLNHIPIQSVINFLKCIYADYNCFVVSNNLYSTIMTGLTSLRLEHCFKSVLGVDSIGRPKPDTRSILILQKKFGVETKSTIMFGDSLNTDGKFCENLKIQFVNISKFI